MKDVLIPRIESLLQETRRTRRAAVAGVILAAIVALLAWGQMGGGGPVAVAQNNEATGTVTLTTTGQLEIHYALIATVSAADDDDLTNVVYTYKWFYVRPDPSFTTCGDGRQIPRRASIDNETLTIIRHDAGKMICVRVEFQDDLLNAEALESLPTIAIPSGAIIEGEDPDNLGQYDITEDTVVGTTLRANIDPVNYSDLVDPPDFSYQWIHWIVGNVGLDGYVRDIQGATSQTYTVQESDAGEHIQVELTFDCDTTFASCLTGGRTTFANGYSDYVDIPPPSLTLTSDAPSGEPEVHFELTATVTVFGVDNPNYFYEWYAVPPRQTLSTTAHLISGASGATYTPRHEDVGKQIVAIVSFRDNSSNPLTATSAPTLTVRSSAVIDAPRGFYIDETLQANTAVMTLQGAPTDPSAFTYLWIYVDANGAFENDAAGTPSDTQSYALTDADDGRYLQVEITFTETVNNTSRMVMANMQTPAIDERPPARYAEDLSAQVPTNGGSVTLTWSLASTQDDLPAKFQYRYKPTMATDYTGTLAQDWEDVSGGVSTRSLTISDLINVADYTFELRSVGRLGLGTPEVSDTATYRHKTRGCPAT